MASSTTQNGTVPQVGSVGALYTITTQQWQTINWWVDMVIQPQQLQNGYGAPPLPNYPALLAACQKWQASTEPGVFAQSAYVGMVAAQMVTALQNLQSVMSGLEPGDALLPGDTFFYRLNLATAADRAAQAQADLTALAPDVANFVAMIQDEASTQQALLNEMGTALQELEVGWSILISQLQELSAPAMTNLPTCFLRLDVTSALAAWSALQQSAAAFDAQANSTAVQPPGLQGP